MAAKTSVLRNAVDTWAEQDFPSKRHPQDAALSVGNGEAIAFVWFAAPMSQGSTITAATLKLYTKGSWGGANPTITVQRVATRYSNSQVDWSNAPAGAGATATKTQASTGDLDEWSFNVAAILQAVADGAAFYGFRITSSSSTVRKFRSAESSSAGRPELSVTWSEAPDKPTRLNPSGGQAVNASKPVLSMNFTDTSGSTELAALQVQIDATGTLAAFATPDFDSGEVASTGTGTARLDLAATAYAGLSEGGTAYWRGRVKDGAGEWSAWSDIDSWTRAAKGTVTITSPPASPAEVDDFTPPVTWTFSLTQSKWQVLVFDADGTELFDSGEVAGMASSCTIDDEDGEAILNDEETYSVEVRAWDNLDRIGTVDDPAYSTATRVFTVVDEPGVAGVDDLSATTVTLPRPGIVLVWERATGVPDEFTIYRERTALATNVPAADLLQGDGSFAYTVDNLRPNVDSTYKVYARVDGESSAAVTIEASPHVVGLWLIDPADTDSHLFVAKTSGSTFTLGEDAATHMPLGATGGIRITQGMRGYEGRIEGVLVGEMGKTRDEWVDQALTMRSRPGRVYRMMIGTEVLTVVIGNLTVRPTGDSTPGLRPVTFDFWEVGTPRVRAVL